jgi:VWFA-related protein
VVDKKGRPVVTGLTKDDFAITEGKKPQRIFSFEAPATHLMNASTTNEVNKAPVTIFVLDQLNSDFEDFAFIRYSVRRYLETQPEQLDTPAEMMVISNDSLEMVQGFTRSKSDLLFALDHVPAILPYKKRASFLAERFGQSVTALQGLRCRIKAYPGAKM